MESEDNSEETLELLRRWNIPANPPEKIIIDSLLVGPCSRPIRKQFTKSDVNGEELVLAVKKKFLPLLEESEIRRHGKTVALYGPDGKLLHDTETWITDSLVDSIAGGRKFVGDYKKLSSGIETVDG